MIIIVFTKKAQDFSIFSIDKTSHILDETRDIYTEITSGLLI